MLLRIRRRPDPPLPSDADRNRDESGLGLRPDPSQLVLTLKELNTKEISGALFVRCLNEYSALNNLDSKSHPFRYAAVFHSLTRWENSWKKLAFAQIDLDPKCYPGNDRKVGHVYP